MFVKILFKFFLFLKLKMPKLMHNKSYKIKHVENKN